MRLQITSKAIAENPDTATNASSAPAEKMATVALSSSSSDAMGDAVTDVVVSTHQASPAAGTFKTAARDTLAVTPMADSNPQPMVAAANTVTAAQLVRRLDVKARHEQMLIIFSQWRDELKTKHDDLNGKYGTARMSAQYNGK